MNRTKQQKLVNRQIKIPNGFLYSVLMIVCKIMNLRINTHFHYNAKPGDEPGPIVMIANHASRNDYLFTAPVCCPKKLNYVVGYNEFFRFPMNILLKVMQVVPKKNFVSDTYAVRQVLKLARKGASIFFMPEGMSSITGMAQPVMPGTGKLIKKIGNPVYYSHICGAYLTYTKHCLDERKGRVDVYVDRMFTAEEVKSMSSTEIEERIDELLAHDDYMWNKDRQYSYKTKGHLAKNLDTLLYMCPKCGAMYKHECYGNTIRCKECGNTVELDDKYNIKAIGDNSVCPEYITDWTIMERNSAAENVRKKDFYYQGHVKIGELPKYKDLRGDTTSIICGDGNLTLDIDGLHFRGTRNGEEFCFDFAPKEIPTFGMCTDISRLYTFVNGEFIEFYPDNNDVLRWDHLTEEMHRFCGGRWQNNDFRHREDKIIV